MRRLDGQAMVDRHQQAINLSKLQHNSQQQYSPAGRQTARPTQ